MKTLEEFISDSRAVHGGKYDYSLSEYKGNKVKVKIICPRHGMFEQKPNDHMMGHGCFKCKCEDINTLQRKNPKDFIKEAKIIHNEYDYSKCNYVNSFTKVIVACPIHGEFETRPADHINHEAGCPKCNSSKGEKYIRNWLNGKNIKFNEQKRFRECRDKRPLPFDFFLPNHNILIEFDGEQHHSSRWLGKERYKETTKRDTIKTEWANSSSYQLVRIRYDEDIEQKLQEVLISNA